MSTTEMAARMGIPQSGISALERGETEGRIKLDTLRRAAEALGCDLVYVLVPRTSLANAVSMQARRKAESHLRSVGHHMRLEDQDVGDPDRTATIDELAKELVDKRGLWTELRPKS